jgi:hypothetical protein
VPPGDEWRYATQTLLQGLPAPRLAPVGVSTRVSAGAFPLDAGQYLWRWAVLEDHLTLDLEVLRQWMREQGR